MANVAIARDTPALDEAHEDCTKIGGNHRLDEAILAALPQHLRVLSADRYGTSAWSATASIKTESADGKLVRFFVKYAVGEHGKSQLEGECRSMEEIHRTIPGLAPKPHCFGELQSSPSPTYFFLCDFVNISDELPDPKALGTQLAQLHHQSQSPTGKFGFYCPTYDGKLPQTTEWDSSWASYFTKLLTGIAGLDEGVNGRWDELQQALDLTVEKVIPRLLGALEQHGREIKPCLIHGDLWEGNIGTDLETGQIYIFDAASYYGHNEMELGIWRTDHHRMHGPSYKREYERNFPASEPVYEWDDRNRLYSIKTQLMYSAHVPGTTVRNGALNNLHYLNNKYALVHDEDQTEGTSVSAQHAGLNSATSGSSGPSPKPGLDKVQPEATIVEV